MSMDSHGAGRRQRPPTHPGEVLRQDALPALGVSVSRAARDMGVSRMTLHRLLQGRTRVTPAMALRLGRYCGNGAAIWLRMQDAHDLWHALRDIGDEIERIPPRHAQTA